MRYSTALKLAALALGLGGSAIVCQAQPGGSYRQTCRDVSVRGSTLYATCQDQGGNWRNTQLSAYDRCNGDIQNLNGNLSCTGGNGYGSGDRRDGDNRYGRDRDANRGGDRDHDRDGYNGPPGSYSQTCSNIQVNGNTLQASCQKKNGKMKNTSLRNFRDCRDIQNDNGKLRCTR
ncbi:MAG TPA: CVNH domain-containing protein [Candidatus Acidoferrales bacterium]|nr:CVNH domain-containing protein [Candidatus Acidoferrales bacterium]